MTILTLPTYCTYTLIYSRVIYRVYFLATSCIVSCQLYPSPNYSLPRTLLYISISAELFCLSALLVPYLSTLSTPSTPSTPSTLPIYTLIYFYFYFLPPTPAILLHSPHSTLFLLALSDLRTPSPPHPASCASMLPDWSTL